MSLQYRELRPTNSWDRLAGLGHPVLFQWVSRLGSVTARQSSSGCQPNFAVLNRGRHLFGRATITLGIGPHCSSISFFSFPRPISAVAHWMSAIHTWCGLSANLGCRSETCCTWLAANTGRKKSPSVHHRTNLSGCVFATKACIDNRKETC